MKLRTEAGLFALAALTIVGGFWLAGKAGEVVGDELRKEADKRVDRAGAAAQDAVSRLTLGRVPPSAEGAHERVTAIRKRNLGLG